MLIIEAQRLLQIVVILLTVTIRTIEVRHLLRIAIILIIEVQHRRHQAAVVRAIEAQHLLQAVVLLPIIGVQRRHRVAVGHHQVGHREAHHLLLQVAVVPEDGKNN